MAEDERDIYFYAVGNNFSNANNPVPEEFINQLICGDSEEFLKKLPDNCIDLIFTSPPYNFGKKYSKTGDMNKWDEYFKKLFAILVECVRVLKFGGRIVINIQPAFSQFVPTHHFISTFLMQQKMIWKGEIIWEKQNYNCKVTAWGSWKSPSNPYLKCTWEFLEVFCKGDLKHEGKSDDADITEREFKKLVIAKWNIPPERRMGEIGHPAMFPEELAEAVLKLFSFRGDVVLDPFCGVGTTCIVAKRLRRRWIGVEISKKYEKKAKKRFRITLDDFVP